MNCTHCGKETGSSMNMCKICMAGGGPRSVRPPSGGLFENSAVSSMTPKPSAPQPSMTQSSAPTPPPQENREPSVYYPTKQKEPKPPKEPRVSSGGSGDFNIFAILGLVFAFCNPLAGIVLSVFGLVKSSEDGGKNIALVGLLTSIVVIALFILAIALGMISIKFTVNFGS